MAASVGVARGSVSRTGSGVGSSSLVAVGSGPNVPEPTSALAALLKNSVWTASIAAAMTTATPSQHSRVTPINTAILAIDTAIAIR